MHAYTPSLPPGSSAQAVQEAARLSRALREPEPYLMLQTLAREPADKREGMVCKADGVSWNPGGGAGYYGYLAGSWVKF